MASRLREPNAADRFSELMRAMAEEESNEALAVFFNQSVTTINNWCKGTKSPREIDDLIGKCGLDEIRFQDAVIAEGGESMWRPVIIDPAGLVSGRRWGLTGRLGHGQREAWPGGAFEFNMTSDDPVG